MQTWAAQPNRTPELHLSLPDIGEGASGPCGSSSRSSNTAAAAALAVLKAAASELGSRHTLSASCGDVLSALPQWAQHRHAVSTLFAPQLRAGVLLQPQLQPVGPAAAAGTAAAAAGSARELPVREVGVTGGLGALGLLLAQWLSLAGCSGLHLLGRSGRAEPAALQALVASQVPAWHQAYKAGQYAGSPVCGGTAVPACWALPCSPASPGSSTKDGVEL